MALSLDDIQPGFYYEINPAKLTPKDSHLLKQIRFLTVCEKTESRITMRYPSMSSLRTHFNGGQNTRRNTKTIMPAFDEIYVMDVGVAGEVFVRRIMGSDQIDGVLSFWSSISDGVVSKKGSWWSELMFSGMVHWGKRKVRTLSSRRRKVKEDEDDEMDLEVGGGGEEEGDEVSERGLLPQKNEKRKESDNNMKTITQTNKKARGDEPRRNQATSAGKTTKIIKNSTSRWSEERYKSAEQKMLKVMKEKGAVFSKPILRSELRAEARNLIGDTGLLDNLLSDMTGKLAPGGAERYQRRYNADGVMEYWLESADLMNIRKEAGVHDPYWTPPPGWQPGDCPSHDPVCAREFKKIKKRLDEMERLVKELISEKQERQRDQCLKLHY